MLRAISILILIFSISVFGFENTYKYADIKSDKEGIKLISEKGFDIVRESMKKTDGIYYFQVYITDEQFNELKSLGFDPKVIIDDRTYEEKSKGYRTNDSIGLEFDSLETAYPTMCKKIQVGTSVEGRPLWAIKISDNANDDEIEPEFKYSSTMHGDEVVGMEFCMELIYDIIEGYNAENDTMKYIVDNTELFIMPLHNPDGKAAGSRYNANGIDLNRAFPERIYDQENTVVGKQAEVAAMINWNNDRNFVMSANFHGGALVANYPWDADPVLGSGDYAASPDDANFIFISRGYADRNQTMIDFDNGITNGCDWYEITGGMQDWNYHYYGAMDVTMEVSYTKWPTYSTIPTYWANNRSSMLWYLMAVHRGVKGIVAGNYTTKSEPIAATLRFDGIDKDIFSDSVTGEYYKILKPGTYAVTASAAGYATKYITDIVVKDSLATVLNIELDGVGIEDDTAQLPNGIILEQNYPNPFNPSTNISFSLDRQLELNIYIYDRKGNTVKEFARREFKAGRHTIEFNAEGLSSGVYYCCLKDVEGGEISKKMLMLK